MTPADRPTTTSHDEPVEVLVLVALREEFGELLASIAEDYTVVRNEHDRVYLFRRAGPVGQPHYVCAAMLIGSMGPTAGALTAQRALASLRPATVVLIGIAAGIDADVRVGDVIVADVVDAYLEHAKATPDADDGFELRLAGEPYRTSDALRTAVQHFEFEHAGLWREWQDAGRAALPDAVRQDPRVGELVADLPALQVGHLASGPVVGAAAAFTELLKRRDRKYLGLEMEAAGLLAAVHRPGVHAESLVIRGVSDLGDERKHSLDAFGAGSLRRLAMGNALRALWALLAAGALARNPTRAPSRRAEPMGGGDASGIHAPQPRNRWFVGRAPTLAAVRDRLTTEREPRIVALTGMGGVGKSQIALEYIYRHTADTADHRLALWAPADSRLTLQRELAALAKPLLAMSLEVNEEVRWQAVRGHLAARSDWLLVVDNVPTPEVFDSMRPLLPERFAGHVVLTSRFPHWGAVADEVPVRPLDRNESVELLHRCAGAVAAGAPNAAGALAQGLGDLPLALVQAGAYMRSSGKSFTAYLDLFRREHARLLAQGRPSDYPDTVATTWSLAMERVREFQPAAADLLTFCAFLAPFPLLPSWLRASAELLPPALAGLGDSELAWDEVVKALGDLSLITIGPDFFLVHQLVQAVTRARLTADEQRLWNDAALRWATALYTFSPDDAGTWAQGAMIFPHLLDSIRRGVERNPLPALLPKAIRRALTELWNRVDLRPAKELLEYANACDFAGADGTRLQIECVRARVVLREGDALAARSLLERVLSQIDETADEDERLHAQGVVHSDLAVCSLSLGDYQGALVHARTSLEALERSESPSMGHIATSLGSLAAAHIALDQFAAARDAYRQVLAIYDSIAPPPHGRYAAALNNLADALLQLGEIEEALAHGSRAYAMSRAVFGPVHPMPAGVLRTVYKVLLRLGRRQEAMEAVKAALEIDTIVLPASHPTLAGDHCNLGQCYLEQGRLDDAFIHLKRAFNIGEQAHGAHNVHTAKYRAQYGRVLRERRQYPAARSHLERALADLEAAGMGDSTDAAMMLTNLAVVYMDLKMWEMALDSARRGLAIDERLHGPDHPEVADDLFNIGSILVTRELPEEAEPCLRRCVDIRQRHLKSGDYELQFARRVLAKCLVDQGKHREAVSLFDALITVGQSDSYTWHDKSEMLIDLRIWRAASLDVLGEFVKAEADLSAALASMQQSGRTDTPEFAEYTRLLAAMRARRGRSRKRRLR